MRRPSGSADQRHPATCQPGIRRDEVVGRDLVARRHDRVPRPRVLYRAVEHHRGRGEDDERVADPFQVPDDVRRKEHRPPVRNDRIAERGQKVEPREGIEPCHRLVKQQNGSMGPQRERQGDLRLLPA
jgi:hypothetical protein